MSQHYSDPKRESDPYALPDVEVFQLTAREAAEMDEDLIHDYLTRHEFRLATVNTKTRERMFDAMIEKEGIEGGWFYQYCFPGCMPESDPRGPFPSHQAAVKAMREEWL